MASPVKDEVLKEEDAVEQYRTDWQDELDAIESSRCEKGLAQSYWEQGRLKQRENATCQIEQDVLKWPTLGALTLPVQVYLGQVFNESNRSFTVTHHQKCVSGVWAGVARDLNDPIGKNDNIGQDEENNPESVNFSLSPTLSNYIRLSNYTSCLEMRCTITYIVDEDLGQLDGAECEGMECENQVLVSHLLIHKKGQ